MMNAMTLKHIEQNLTRNKDQPRKLNHWQVKHDEWVRTHPKVLKKEVIEKKVTKEATK